MKIRFKKGIFLGMIIIFLTNLVACGTILYPERKGQINGHIDPKIAILNGIGLLFFLVPGVIAFAIDFNNGSIYLPRGRKFLSDADIKGQNLKISSKSFRMIPVQPKMNISQLETVLVRETGLKLDLRDKAVQVQALPINIMNF